MNAKPLICLITAILAMSILPSAAVAQEREHEAIDAIAQRLDRVLKRLDDIETRLAKLEADLILAKPWWVDEQSVIRNSVGRPIGIWGVDDVPVTTLRR